MFAQKSPLDLSFFYKLTGKMEAEGNPELFYPSARPMLPPQDYDLAAEVENTMSCSVIRISPSAPSSRC